MKPSLRWMRWMMILLANLLVAGCAVGGNYCDVAQPPFRWQSDAEIDATPIRPLKWIEAEAAIWYKLCK